jgi:hypothetical protein
MCERNASIFRRKAPVDGDSFLVASLLPRFDLPLKFRLIFKALV